jgi:hypothetical protein
MHGFEEKNGLKNKAKKCFAAFLVLYVILRTGFWHQKVSFFPFFTFFNVCGYKISTTISFSISEA